MPEFIETSLRKLKLGGLAKESAKCGISRHEQYLTALLELELKEREANRINRMVRTAGFNVIKRLKILFGRASVAYFSRTYNLTQFQFMYKNEYIKIICTRL